MPDIVSSYELLAKEFQEWPIDSIFIVFGSLTEQAGKTLIFMTLQFLNNI